jgi:ABC-type Fe3+ transport system substrate-binding protein
MGVLTRGPHPNATKVFLNWLLTKEAQLAWQKLSGDNSLRVDISKEGLAADLVPREGAVYFHVNQAKYHLPKDLEAVRKITEESRGKR